jgi:hypothetical protein
MWRRGAPAFLIARLAGTLLFSGVCRKAADVN